MAEPADGTAAHLAIERAYREEWTSLLATFAGQVGGDVGLAEEAVADAFAAAAEEWPAGGVPTRPGGWLTTVARRRAIDTLRRAKTRRVNQAALEHLEALVRHDNDTPTADGRRPTITAMTAVASPTTGSACSSPASARPPRRRSAARRRRGSRAARAPAAHRRGRPARTDADGTPISLEDQDRSRWDRDSIAEGTIVLEHALGLGAPGPFQVQAAVAALHAEAPSWDATDWPQIAALYGELHRLAPSPVVTLNRAAAIALADDPHVGLALLATLEGDERLDRYQPLHATRAELLARAGDLDHAADAYRRAIDLTHNSAEQRALIARATRLGCWK